MNRHSRCLVAAAKPLHALLVSLAAAAFLLPIPAAAQAVKGAPPKAEQPEAKKAETTAEPETESIGADGSPRAALWHFFDATRAGRWDEAARYLALNAAQKPRGEQLARRLKAVIDDTHWIDLETISDQPGGKLDDGLPPQWEEVSRITIGGREESLRMVRSSPAQGVSWVFSPNTVARIDAWYQRLPDRWLRDGIDSVGLDILLLPGPLELLWYHWVAVLVLIVASWALGNVLGRLTSRLLARVVNRRPDAKGEQLLRAVVAPLTLVWGLNLFWLGAQFLVLTEPAYRTLDSAATAGMVFAVFWALWRSSSLITERMLQQPWALQSAAARTMVTVGSNFARGAILAVGALAMLAAFGYPIGTLLAGLGIGGLALAFGAQKTIENLFGSVSIAVDQPFRVGDFVRVEDFVGTVEDIGLRSTRIRTLDRTVVSIPNGKLADQRLESYDARDRMRLATTIGLVYHTTREQMQQVLTGFERVLKEHPRIWPDAVVVKFSQFGANSLDIEVMAWFQVPTWDEFRRCREDVLLAFMQVVEAAGTSFAFPTRTVHLVREPRAA